jgi:hypothetical protein
MSGARFPAKRDDGSFSVAAQYEAAAEITVSSVQTELERLVQRMSECSHVFSFEDEFTSMPVAEARDDLIEVVFHGRPGSSLWKDRLVALCLDLDKSISGLKRLGFRDLVSGRPHPSWAGER